MADPIDINRMISRCQDWGNDDAEEAAWAMCAEIQRLRERNLDYARQLAGLRADLAHAEAKAEAARADADTLAARVDRLRAVEEWAAGLADVSRESVDPSPLDGKVMLASDATELAAHLARLTAEAVSCAHGVSPHGCPSCDARDTEDGA